MSKIPYDFADLKILSNLHIPLHHSKLQQLPYQVSIQNFLQQPLEAPFQQSGLKQPCDHANCMSIACHKLDYKSMHTIKKKEQYNIIYTTNLKCHASTSAKRHENLRQY